MWDLYFYKQRVSCLFFSASMYTVGAPLKASACIFFTPFFTAVYIVERLVLQTIYVLDKEILQFLDLKSVVYNRERIIMAHVRYLFFYLPIYMFLSAGLYPTRLLES